MSRRRFTHFCVLDLAAVARAGCPARALAGLSATHERLVHGHRRLARRDRRAPSSAIDSRPVALDSESERRYESYRRRKRYLATNWRMVNIVVRAAFIYLTWTRVWTDVKSEAEFDVVDVACAGRRCDCDAEQNHRSWKGVALSGRTLPEKIARDHRLVLLRQLYETGRFVRSEARMAGC